MSDRDEEIRPIHEALLQTKIHHAVTDFGVSFDVQHLVRMISIKLFIWMVSTTFFFIIVIFPHQFYFCVHAQRSISDWECVLKHVKLRLLVYYSMRQQHVWVCEQARREICALLSTARGRCNKLYLKSAMFVPKHSYYKWFEICAFY